MQVEINYTDKELKQKCQENDWVKRFGVMFAEDPFAETDYKYCFTRCSTLAELKTFFLQGNWAIRQGFIYKSLAFINQINGGDEWWTLKKFPDGEIIAFESISMRHILTNCSNPTRKECEQYKYFECQKKGYCKYRGLTNDKETWKQYMERLIKATKEQCLKLEY